MQQWVGIRKPAQAYPDTVMGGTAQLINIGGLGWPNIYRLMGWPDTAHEKS